MTRNSEMELERRDDGLNAEELELISQYICHEMSPAAEQAFERRLVDDAEFHERVMPLLDVWYSDELTSALAAEPAPEPVVVTRRPSGKTVRRTWVRWAGVGSGLAAAAGIAFAMLQQVVGAGPTPSPILVGGGPDEPTHAPAVAVLVPPVRVAKRDVTIRGTQRQFDSAVARIVVANNDSTAARVIGELAQSGTVDPQAASSSRMVPVEDSVRVNTPHVSVPVLIERTEGPASSPFPQPVGGPPPTNSDPAPAVNVGGIGGWLRGIINRVWPRGAGAAAAGPPGVGSGRPPVGIRSH